MNEAAERLRELDRLVNDTPGQWVILPQVGMRAVISLQDVVKATRAAERRATVERIAAQVDEYIAAFPSRNRTSLYGQALALRERLAQMAEQDAILDAEAG